MQCVLRREDHVLQMPSLIVIGDIENFTVLAGDGIAVKGLDLHVLPECVAVACFLKHFFFGGEFLDDLLRSDSLGRIVAQRAFLRKRGQHETKNNGS